MKPKTVLMTGFSLLTFWLLMAVVNCGPSISREVRYDWQPYDKNEYRQAKEGVTVENRDVAEFPGSFYAKVQACSVNGAPLTDEQGNPKMVTMGLAAPGQYWYQVAITNNTDHVLRLNSVVIRMFDPAGNQYEPFSKEDALGQFAANWPCPSQIIAMNQFRLVKLFEKNTEILPNTTVTGWLAFKPADFKIPGVWKLAIYEVPVKVDEAGKVIKTTKFELRTVVKKFIDTYKQEGMFKPKKLVETKEVSD